MTQRPKPGTDFGRLKPRTIDTSAEPVVTPAPQDQEGKRALFSASGDDAVPPAATGAVIVTCGDCGERSVLSPAQALRHAVPSLHLPLLKRDKWSWMHCPACGRRTWVDVTIQL
jgi:hypothetical protein